MKVELWSIGKANEAMYDAGITEFSRRLQHYCDFQIKIITSKANINQPIPKQKSTEGQQVIQLLDKSDLLVVLDEYGKELTTIQLSEKLQSFMNQSAKKIVFLIGGAYGLDETIMAKANFKLSLSKLTFPHQLVRLLFTEQLYRAYTILNNEKYHHI